MRYRKNPVVIDAWKWGKHGDHERVIKVRERAFLGIKECEHCHQEFHKHGLITTLEDTPQSSHLVCPGDWIIRDVNGEYYNCKPDIFEQTYEKVK